MKPASVWMVSVMELPTSASSGRLGEMDATPLGREPPARLMVAWMTANVAVTLRALSMLTVQTPVPLQWSLQPTKRWPASGVAVRVICSGSASA